MNRLKEFFEDDTEIISKDQNGDDADFKQSPTQKFMVAAILAVSLASAIAPVPAQAMGGRKASDTNLQLVTSVGEYLSEDFGNDLNALVEFTYEELKEIAKDVSFDSVMETIYNYADKDISGDQSINDIVDNFSIGFDDFTEQAGEKLEAFRSSNSENNQEESSDDYIQEVLR